MFRHRPETPAADQFEMLLDEALEDFEQMVKLHKARLASLRGALRDTGDDRDG